MRAELTAKPAKGAWGSKYLQYLGHTVGNGLMAVPDHMISAMKDFVKPRTKKGRVWGCSPQG